MAKRRSVAAACIAVALLAVPAAAQTPDAVALGAFPPAALGLAAAPGLPAARNGLVWDGRPALLYGDRFRVEARLLLLANVRQSAIDLASRGGSFEWDITRASIKGSLLKYFEFEVQHDLNAGGKWRDVYLNVRPAAFAQVQFGQFKIPFCYEWLTGRSDLTFVDRTNASNAIAAGRDVGVMAHGRAFKRVLRYQAGVFRHDGDGAPKLESVDLLPGEQPAPRSRAYAGRVTIAPLRLAPLRGKYNNLEIGGSFVSSTVPEGRNHLHGKTALGDNFFGRRFETNGRRLRTGVEMSWDIGAASVCAEFLRSKEARQKMGVGNEAQLDNDLPAIVSQGWYVAGTWVMTGEKREGGVMPKRPFLQGGLGAVELTARYEQLRFWSDGAPSDPVSSSRRATNILGNRDRAVTAGVNWYLNRFVRVRVNGIREQLDDPGQGPAPDRPAFWTVISQVQVGF